MVNQCVTQRNSWVHNLARNVDQNFHLFINLPHEAFRVGQTSRQADFVSGPICFYSFLQDKPFSTTKKPQLLTDFHKTLTFNGFVILFKCKGLYGDVTYLNPITMACASESHPALNYTLWPRTHLADCRTSFLLLSMDIRRFFQNQQYVLLVTSHLNRSKQNKDVIWPLIISFMTACWGNKQNVLYDHIVVWFP